MHSPRTCEQLKFRRSMRRLSKQVISLYGRYRSREINALGFKHNKRRSFADLTRLRRFSNRPVYLDGSMKESFHFFEGRLGDRLAHELNFRETKNLEEGYYGFEFEKPKSRHYIRRASHRLWKYAHSHSTKENSFNHQSNS